MHYLWLDIRRARFPFPVALIALLAFSLRICKPSIDLLVLKNINKKSKNFIKFINTLCNLPARRNKIGTH